MIPELFSIFTENSFPTQSVKLCKLSVVQKKRFEAVDIFIMERNDNSTVFATFLYHQIFVRNKIFQ